MKHIMNLTYENMCLIRSGKKCREIRLYDEKRRNIHIGDEIFFQNLDNNQDTFLVVVKEFVIRDSFLELFQAIPLEEGGWLRNTLPEVAVQDMRKYYSLEQEKEHGVIAITFYEKSTLN